MLRSGAGEAARRPAAGGLESEQPAGTVRRVVSVPTGLQHAGSRRPEEGWLAVQKADQLLMLIVVVVVGVCQCEQRGAESLTGRLNSKQRFGTQKTMPSLRLGSMEADGVRY